MLLGRAPEAVGDGQPLAPPLDVSRRSQSFSGRVGQAGCRCGGLRQRGNQAGDTLAGQAWSQSGERAGAGDVVVEVALSAWRRGSVWNLRRNDEGDPARKSPTSEVAGCGASKASAHSFSSREEPAEARIAVGPGGNGVAQRGGVYIGSCRLICSMQAFLGHQEAGRPTAPAAGPTATWQKRPPPSAGSRLVAPGHAPAATGLHAGVATWAEKRAARRAGKRLLTGKARAFAQMLGEAWLLSSDDGRCAGLATIRASSSAENATDFFIA